MKKLRNDFYGDTRTRNFSYDSLSRLLNATNPESGTISYAYDNDGNISTRTAPSPNQTAVGTGAPTVVTTYTYDALNRLTGKSYSDGFVSNPATTKVEYGYDGIALSNCPTAAPPGDADANPVGRRTSMCDGSGASTWKHDVVGRILEERRTIGTAVGKYDTDIYNLDGSIRSLNVPGYNVTYTHNGAQRETSAINFTTPQTNYVSTAHFAPFGGMTSATYNAGTTAITTTDSYNSRLQPVTNRLI